MSEARYSGVPYYLVSERRTLSPSLGNYRGLGCMIKRKIPPRSPLLNIAEHVALESEGIPFSRTDILPNRVKDPLRSCLRRLCASAPVPGAARVRSTPEGLGY